MKFSTLGFGFALFLFVIVSGSWIVSAGNSRPSTGPKTDYLVLGQDAGDATPVPPAKLNQGAARGANPLRRGPQVDASSVDFRPVSDVQSKESGQGSQVAPAMTVADRGNVVPRNEAGSERRPTSFENVSSPFGAPGDNFLESAGFPQDPAPLPAPTFDPTATPPASGEFPSPAPFEPQPLPTPAQDSPPAFEPFPSAYDTTIPFQPVSADPSPLSNADPFAVGAASIASPPIAESQPEPPVSVSVPQRESGSASIPVRVEDPAPAPAPARDRTRARAPKTVVVNNDEGSGMPGPVSLEGAQTPHLTLEKVFPTEIIIEQPTTIKTVIKNVGRSTAKDVVIRDRVPQGTRLLSTLPEAQTTTDGELVWSLGNLDGSEQLIVETRVIPLREGEIGSVATISYSAEASARKMVTRPNIHVEVKAPQEIRLGQIANVEITISNPGTATATGIELEEYVPDGLYHKDGKVLVNKNVKTLKPKEAKKLTLPLTCTGSGTLVNRVVVKADGNLKVEEKTTIRALSPILNLEITGAKQRFLERKSAYSLIVSNSGNASAQNVDLELKLPSAVQFVSTNQSGVYEPTTHTVHWALEELPPQEAGEIDLVVMPGKIGNYTMTFSGKGENNLKAEATHPMAIDGISALSFEVVGQSLVEVGKQTEYEIRVTNKGTKAAGNVKIRATLSDGLTFVKADGPVRYQSQGGTVQFEALSSLDSKGEKVYKIAAKCMSDGDHRVSVQVISDELATPITKEESTRVFQ